jgi:CheY-like chemotaxis protein
MTYMSEKKKYHILIVDDERELCVLMAELIESELVHCSKAYSGEGALARLTQDKLDILITDSTMPCMSGLQLIRRMHEVLEPPPTAYVMSGFSECSRTEIIEAGGKDFFSKP